MIFLHFSSKINDFAASFEIFTTWFIRSKFVFIISLVTADVIVVTFLLLLVLIRFFVEA